MNALLSRSMASGSMSTISSWLTSCRATTSSFREAR
jgi:hypothetical protein